MADASAADWVDAVGSAGGMLAAIALLTRELTWRRSDRRNAEQAEAALVSVEAPHATESWPKFGKVWQVEAVLSNASQGPVFGLVATLRYRDAFDQRIDEPYALDRLDSGTKATARWGDGSAGGVRVDVPEPEIRTRLVVELCYTTSSSVRWRRLGAATPVRDRPTKEIR